MVTQSLVRRNAIALTAAMVAMSVACSTTKADPAQDISAGSLIVSVEEVAQITNFHGFAPASKEADRPTTVDPTAPEVCRAAYDENFAFGAGLTKFRSVTYGGSTGDRIQKPVSISQAIAIYPDESAPRAAFGHLVSELAKCSAAHIKGYEMRIEQPDSSTVLVSSPIWEATYRVKSTVLMNVVGGGLPDTEAAVRTVAGRIADKLS